MTSFTATDTTRGVRACGDVCPTILRPVEPGNEGVHRVAAVE